LAGKHKSLKQQDWPEYLCDGEKPTPEQNQKALLHHTFPPFHLFPEQKGGSLARLTRCPGRKRLGFRPSFAKRTLPALNRNQLADRSLQINLICE
jgi:hypothetical protein